MVKPKELDPEVATIAKETYNIPARQICPKHQTYMHAGFCKVCMREDDPEYQSGPEDRGMNAKESAYVRKHRNRDPDVVLAEFRAKQEQSQ